MQLLNQEKNFNMDMAYREKILSKITSMIESRARRGKPTICDFSNYEKNKEVIEGEIKRKKHFIEEDWPGCVDQIMESLRNIRENEGFDTVSSDDENNDDDFNDKRRR
jgi:hypothetical protein